MMQKPKEAVSASLKEKVETSPGSQLERQEQMLQGRFESLQNRSSGARGRGQGGPSLSAT
jgi:chaperonin cofactor prefoldin